MHFAIIIIKNPARTFRYVCTYMCKHKGTMTAFAMYVYMYVSGMCPGLREWWLHKGVQISKT